jgi:hypothetical protein
MNYKSLDAGLFNQLVANTGFFTELDETEELVPYGIEVNGTMVGSIVRDGYLDAGTFVSVVRRGEYQIPTLYGFSEDTNPSVTTHPQYGAWALALHLRLHPGTRLEDLEYRVFVTSMFLAKKYPDYELQSGDVMYVYLNSLPFCKITRGRTHTYFCHAVLKRYHADVHKFTDDLFQVLVPYLTETMKYENAPEMHINQVAAFEKAVATMDDLMDGGCRASDNIYRLGEQ